MPIIDVRKATEPEAKPDSKKDWELTESAFHQLLCWLDEGGDSGGKEVTWRSAEDFVSFFDRRNCLAPELLADETLNRVARRLKEEGAISNIGIS